MNLIEMKNLIDAMDGDLVRMKIVLAGLETAYSKGYSDYKVFNAERPQTTLLDEWFIKSVSALPFVERYIIDEVTNGLWVIFKESEVEENGN